MADERRPQRRFSALAQIPSVSPEFRPTQNKGRPTPMLTKLVLAAASAGMIAVGSLAATPAAAGTSASISVSIRTPQFSLSIGRPAYHPQPHRVCKPVYKKVYYKYRG